MSTKQIVLALAGLAVAALLGLVVIKGPDAEVKVLGTPGSKPMGTEEEGTFQARQPGSLQLDSKDSKEAGHREGAGRPGSRRAEVDNYRQAHRPPVGTAPRHRRPGGDEDNGGPQVRSQLADPAPRGGAGGEPAGQGGGAARVPVDDWPVDDGQVVDPVEPRQPEEGEVLSLFDGDNAIAKAEAVVDNGVTFDESGANFSLDAEYAVPMLGRMSGESGTISFWVRPDGETSDTDNASLVQLRSHNEWENRLQIWKDGANVRLVFADSNGVESGASYGSDSWGPDEWRMVTATWGDGMTALYVNGLLAGTSQFDGGFKIRRNTLLHVGSNYKEDPRSLSGAVNQFRVYDRPLSPDEVATISSQYPE